MYFTCLIVLLFLCNLNLNAQNKSSTIELLDFHKGSCSYIGYGINQVLHTHIRGDSLFIRVQTNANCNVEILALDPLWFWDKDTLRLDFEVLMLTAAPNSGVLPEPVPEMDCDCLFWLAYVFYYPYNTSIPPLTFKHKTPPYYKGFDLLDDEKINVLDSLGRRQGKWIYDFVYWAKQDRFYYYKDDALIKSEVFYFDFLLKKDKNGRLMSYKRQARIEDYLSEQGILIEYDETEKEKSRQHYSLKRNLPKSKP